MEKIINFFKERVALDKLDCIFLQNSSETDLIHYISKTLPKIFKNDAFKLLIYRDFLKGVLEEPKRKELMIYDSDNEKTCHRGINESPLALKKH